jgi:hypothetical protein
MESETKNARRKSEDKALNLAIPDIHMFMESF